LTLTGNLAVAYNQFRVKQRSCVAIVNANDFADNRFHWLRREEFLDNALGISFIDLRLRAQGKAVINNAIKIINLFNFI
jgi:hypothetical protein